MKIKFLKKSPILLFLLNNTILLMLTGCYSNIHFATIMNNKHDVEENLKNGVHVDSIDQYGSTPLLSAVKMNNYDLVALLLEKGANPNHLDSTYRSPLMHAKSINVARALVEKGADVNYTLPNSNSILIELLVPKREDIFNFLISKGAKIDYANSQGNTVLILSSGWGYKDIVKSLISKGADIYHKDIYGRTALDWAKKEGKMDIYAILSQKIVSDFIEKNDSDGLHNFLIANNEAIATIEDPNLRLPYIGPSSLRIMDIIDLIKAKKKDQIIIAHIKATGGPYALFNTKEMMLLESMGISDEIITAMISITSEYNKEQRAIIERNQQMIKVQEDHDAKQMELKQQQITQQSPGIFEDITKSISKELGKQLIKKMF